MITAPKDGTRILLHYNVRFYEDGTWPIVGTKWEECRWIADKARTGSEPHWEPWCGRASANTTAHISQEDCLAWLPLPL